MFKWDKNSAWFAKGRQGTIYECWSHPYDKGQEKFIFKEFKKGKSNKTFLKEIECHRTAAEVGVAPRIIDFYVGGSGKHGSLSYIVMEKMDQTIFSYLKTHKKLSLEQWGELKRLYEKLDSVNVLHNDSNPANILVRFKPKPRLFILDYGMSGRRTGNMKTCFPLMKERIEREETRIFNNSSQSQRLNKNV